MEASAKNIMEDLFRDSSDFLMIMAVIGILMAMILPIPPFLLDLLLAMNITVAIIVLITVFLGGAAILAVEYYAAEYPTWLAGKLEALLDSPPALAIAALLLLSPAIGAAIYLLLLANRIARAGRFPPPGLAVVRDTPILEGAAARRRAWILRLGSLLLFTLACSTPLVLWSLAGELAVGN